MHFPPRRLALLFPLIALFSAQGASVPVFLSGSATAYPDYTQRNLSTIPVGKTVVVPVVVSGSGPISYSATSSSSVLMPVVKTGYPVMTIQVSYSGTTTTTGTINTLYTFTSGTDGGNPQDALIQASDRNFYGTTLADGTDGFGTIFQYSTTSGSLATIYSFTGGADGGHPYAPIYDSPSGNLYGTTETGGTNNGAGTVYQITITGSLTTLYTFSGGSDGGNPQAGLVTAGTASALFGTTAKGGSGAGTVFKLATSGSQPTLTTLHTFTGGADGGNPQAGLITGTGSILYGATAGGGISGNGTVFQITTSGSLTTLYTFSGSDGANPYAGLFQATDGNLYGATEAGGTNGFGTVFRLTTSGSLTTLHTFTGGSDGAHPYGGVIQATDGNFYGTTETSGSTSGGTGAGTVFQITPSGAFTLLYTFTGGSDGAHPYGGVIQATDGNFYGTTESSGTGAGTIFEVPATYSASFSGAMSFALLRDMAPITTSYIAGFAQAGYYNGLELFRVTNLSGFGQSGFIAQGGDPTNTGTGNPGFSFNDECTPSLIFTGAGQLAMANSGVNTTTYRGTNSTQFFITDGYDDSAPDEALRSLDFNYTIFGQLLQGFDTMQKVMAVSTGTNGSTPVVPIVMKSVTVTENNTDAILLVSAAGVVPKGSTVKVTAKDPSGNKAVTPSLTGTTTTPDLSIPMSSYNDILEDPAILLPHANVFAPLHRKVTLPVVTRDLEFDYLMPDATLLSGSSARVGIFGNIVTVTPKSTSPIGGVTVGLSVTEPFNSNGTEHYTAVSVGLGTGKLTGAPALLTGTPGGALSSSTGNGIGGGSPAFGSFLCSNPAAVPGDFAATINWGDGSSISGTATVTGTAGVSGTGAVTVVKSTYLPATYLVSSTTGHSYSNPGIYPVNVTVSDTNGGVLDLDNIAVVSNSNIYAFGRTFTAAKGSFDGLVATFVDNTIQFTASDFQASINWGDGAVGSGIIRGSNGSFKVYGKHKYTAGATYPVDVAVTSPVNPNHSGYAWSIARLTGVPTHQPPFAQSHIIAQLGNPGFGNGFLDEEVTLFNSGNVASGPIALKFYLSPTNSTTISTADVPLQVGKGSVYHALSVPAGTAVSGAVSDIFVPSAAVSRGKYLIMQVITSDPIGSHMNYPRVFADPNPLIE